MECDWQGVVAGRGCMLPVFRGLADAKIQGKEIAAIVDVAPPTYSKWRTGRLKIPAVTMVFLTLLLADRIEELLIERDRHGVEDPRLEATLNSIQRHLHSQEAINCKLRPDVIRQGTRLFQQWWRRVAGAAECSGAEKWAGNKYLEAPVSALTGAVL